MKKICIVCLCFALIILTPCAAFAKDFDAIPKSIDQIQQGDTYDKGDGEIKVFDKEGNLVLHEKGDISKINATKGQYDNGNYGGLTDIWWFYNILDPFDGSGPKGEGSTWSYAIGGSDYVGASLKLYVNGSLKDTGSAFDYDTDAVTAFADYFHYALHGVMLPCEGNTTHRVIDSSYGWNATFYTDDDF